MMSRIILILLQKYNTFLLFLRNNCFSLQNATLWPESCSRSGRLSTNTEAILENATAGINPVNPGARQNSVTIASFPGFTVCKTHLYRDFVFSTWFLGVWDIKSKEV